MKAATRLRTAGKRSARLRLNVKAEHARGTPVPRWAGEVRLAPVMDTPALLAALEGLWAEMLDGFPHRRLLQLGVVLSDLSDAAAAQPGLFEADAARDESRRLALSRALDAVNARFGRDAVTLGHDALGAVRSAGPRIAFTRIPDMAEFRA
jgi:DNA polymerase-4